MEYFQIQYKEKTIHLTGVEEEEMKSTSEEVDFIFKIKSGSFLEGEMGFKYINEIKPPIGVRNLLELMPEGKTLQVFSSKKRDLYVLVSNEITHSAIVSRDKTDFIAETPYFQWVDKESHLQIFKGKDMTNKTQLDGDVVVDVFYQNKIESGFSNKNTLIESVKESFSQEKLKILQTLCLAEFLYYL